MELTDVDLAQLKRGTIPNYFKDKNKDELILLLVDRLIDCEEAIKSANHKIWDVRTELEEDPECSYRDLEKLKEAENILDEVETL